MENVTTTSAGIGGTAPTVMSGDTYAPGDTRVAKVLGADKKKKKEKIPIQRRPFPNTL